MKLTVILAASLAAVSVNADSCNRGGVYCGSSLLNRGNYRNHIVRTLKDAGQPINERRIKASLFDCLADGDIRYRRFCGKGCGGVGSLDPDYCL